MSDPCPYCEGKGHIKSPATVCYEIIRSLQRLGANNIQKRNISIEVHPSVYDLLFEEESAYLDELENMYHLEFQVKINTKFHQEQYSIVS